MEAIRMKKTALIGTLSKERKRLGEPPPKMSCTRDQTTFPQPFSDTKTFPNLQPGNFMLTLPTALSTQLHIRLPGSKRNHLNERVSTHQKSCLCSMAPATAFLHKYFFSKHLLQVLSFLRLLFWGFSPTSRC